MDGAILVCSAADGPDAPDRASTSCWPVRSACLHHRVPEQVRHGRRRRAARTRRDGSARTAVSKYDFPGDDTPSSRAAPSWPWKATRATLGEGAIMKLADALDSYFPTPERAIDGAFLMPVEDVFSISGRGTARDRPCRARHRQGWRRNRNRRHPAHRKDHLHRRARCSASCSTKVRRATTSASCCAAPSVKTSKRGQVLCKPGSHQAAHALHGGGLRAEQGRRRPSHAVLQQLPSAVLLPHHTDVTGAIELPEDKEMVMPGDNVSRSRSS